jgi:hypothetical protein
MLEEALLLLVLARVTAVLLSDPSQRGTVTSSSSRDIQMVK